jgi:hypothetical protein
MSLRKRATIFRSNAEMEGKPFQAEFANAGGSRRASRMARIFVGAAVFLLGLLIGASVAAWVHPPVSCAPAHPLASVRAGA